MILTIDPGVGWRNTRKGVVDHRCAWAVGDPATGKLRKVGFGRYGDALALQPYHFTEVVVERPEYQGQRSDNARIQDLIDLPWEGALFAGAMAGQHNATLKAYTPREWKGEVPKPAHHLRLWECLDPLEKMILGSGQGDPVGQVIRAAARAGALDRWAKNGTAYYPAKFTTHNLLDAAGLFKFAVYGRALKPGRFGGV